MLQLAGQVRDEGAALSGEPEHSALIVQIADARSRTAFVTLFVHYAPRIKSVMMRAGADASFAEDLAQDTMLGVWRKANLFDPGRGSASAWIFTIARNLRIDRLRGQSSQPHKDIDGLEIASDDKDGETHTHEAIVSQHVSAAIGNLPDKQRDVLHLSFVEGLAHGRIAKRLGVPLGTVKSRLRLAYDRLRQDLENLK